MTGIYIHIPFCRQRCYYCDFFSQTELFHVDRYLEAIKNQMAGYEARSIDSIYIGGGTPSLLDSSQIANLLETINKGFKLDSNTEITVEVNPDSADKEKLYGYLYAGVNRLSIGVQSFSDRTLRTIGRLHTAEKAEQTILDAHRVGFTNIAADIMLGLPYEGKKEVKGAIEILAKTGVHHISAYILKISGDTPFGKEYPEGIADDDTVADIYCYAVEQLEAKGYLQYEISNFAKRNYEGRHNKKYWNCEEYIGLGAGAFSLLESYRYHLPGDIPLYLKTFENPSPNFMKGLVLDGPVEWDDYIIVRLRTTEGLSTKRLEQLFGFQIPARIEEEFKGFIELGLMKRENERIRLTTEGFLLSNDILSRLLLAAEYSI